MFTLYHDWDSVCSFKVRMCLLFGANTPWKRIRFTRDVVPCVFINNYSNGIPVTTYSTVDGIKWAVAPEKQTGKMQEHV